MFGGGLRRAPSRVEGGGMILPIGAEATLEVRHPVLRPGRARADAIFSCDEAEGTRHFGSYAETGRLVGVVTVHPACWVRPPAVADLVVEAGAWQLRGMATLPEVRGEGHGVRLVKAAERCVRSAGAGLCWCNARVAAIGFYEKLGWEVVGGEFEIATVGPHFRMVRLLG